MDDEGSMIKKFTTLKLAEYLHKIASWLEKKKLANTKSKFVSLASTDDEQKVDKNGIYCKAILEATNDPKVANIALTGPYGSGKSSIIQLFLKKHRPHALQISLAAFDSESNLKSKEPSCQNKGKASRQDIERSILQQMLYGADADKLPFSRFKRIQSPSTFSILKSLYILLGLLALWYVFHHRENIVSGDLFEPFALSNWLNLGSVVLSIFFIWSMLHHFYIASFGFSLKGISLKNVEIKPAKDDEASILNRHLDEIVYFFQSTKYNLVIIEDLDRFNDAEIFVTLREINSLINENAGVKRNVRFLYALRDDIFINTDRTKFFEFIIPVIPIINSSNSIDMILKQTKRLQIDKNLNQQFLREVSRYLSDLRLIQNIFNEYVIYAAKLHNDQYGSLDKNKLLATLIYKNVYPQDFEKLHHGDGTFAEILHSKELLIEKTESQCKDEILKLEKELEVAEQQTPADLNELKKIYAMTLIEMLPKNTQSVSPDNRAWIMLQNLVSHNLFEEIIESKNLKYKIPNSADRQFDSFTLQNKVSSQKSYSERKTEIERKSIDNEKKTLSQIRDLKTKIEALRMTKFNELLRSNFKEVKALFDQFDHNKELARFLILEGYLDDTYYQYTSLFHEGRLSPNDNHFLIQIRAYTTPEPSTQIDNPKEVIEAMREEDFQQSYVLNVKIVDTLLSNRDLYIDQIEKLFAFISSKFDLCEEFFKIYYSRGQNVAGLLSELVDLWGAFVPTALSNPQHVSHATQLVVHLPESELRKLAENSYDLSECVAENLPEVLLSVPELEPERLEYLGLEVKDLPAIKEHSRIARHLSEKGLYELTITNVEFIYQNILGENDLTLLRESNYTTIRSMKNAMLRDRIDQDFDRYFSNILLLLEENSKEDSSAILAVIQRDTLDVDAIRAFLEPQTTLLPILKDVPDKLHSMLFQLNNIEPTWSNCLTFIECDVYDKDILVTYLDQSEVISELLKHPIPDSSDSLKLRQLLLNAGSLSDIKYKKYVQALPKPFKDFPTDLEPEKISILIDEGRIEFTKDSFDQLVDNEVLQVLFVSTNIDDYLADPDTFELNDEFLENLLEVEFSDDRKLKIIELMDLDAVIGLPKRSKIIGSILCESAITVSDFNANVLQSMIENLEPDPKKITLLNKYHHLLEKDQVFNVLEKLPKPFCGIKIGANIPKLKSSEENLNLVEWLKSREVISSWNDKKQPSDDIKVYLFKK